MSCLYFSSSSEEETLGVGRALAAQLGSTRVVCLSGQLGAGKTALTRGLVEGLGVEDSTIVHSPSFTLINEYPGAADKIYHIDLYRLESLKDHYSIGLDEILWEDAFVIIEWAEKLRIVLDDYVSVEIDVLEDESRKFTIRSYGRPLLGPLEVKNGE